MPASRDVRGALRPTISSGCAPAPVDPAWRNGRRHSVGYVGVIGQSEGIDLLLQSIGPSCTTRTYRRPVQYRRHRAGMERSRRALRGDEALRLRDLHRRHRRRRHCSRCSSTADVCVNPDRVTPMNDISTMNKIMEYMAPGRPIVQFDVREGRRSALDARSMRRRTIRSISPSKIIALIDDPAQRQTMGAFGRSRVERNCPGRHEEPKLLAGLRGAVHQEGTSCRAGHRAQPPSGQAHRPPTPKQPPGGHHLDRPDATPRS